MGARTYRPRRDDAVAIGQDTLRQHARNIVHDQLLPRIAKQNQLAVETVQTPLYFFSKIRGGRRCSCFDIEVSPNAHCRACFGTGYVGGYEKYGTNLEVVDVTHPSVQTINVMPDYLTRERPRRFILCPGATFGHFTTRIYLKTNIGQIDHTYTQFTQPNGTEMFAFLRAPTDSTFVEYSNTAVENRLYNPWVDLKITMWRPSVRSPSPRFGLFYLRYNRVDNPTVLANIPRTEKSNMLQEFGVTDAWQQQRFWLDNRLRSVTTEDWVAHINENTRWKINEVNEFAPEDKLLSWDLTTRLVHPYESQTQVPL